MDLAAAQPILHVLDVPSYPSVIPALSLADQEVAERLHPRHRLEFLRVDEKSVERDGFRLAEQLYEAAVLFDDVVRQHRNAEPGLTGAQDADDVVDDEVRVAWALAVAGDFHQPARVLEILRYMAAHDQKMMLVEILMRMRRAHALEIFRGRKGVKVHREQLAPDQVGLGRLPQADGDVGLPHRKIKFLVGGDQGDANVRIELAELAKPRRQPMHPDADRGGDLEIAIRTLAAVGPFGARRFDLHEHFVGGTVEKIAMFGKYQAARRAVEQRNREFLL